MRKLVVVLIVILGLYLVFKDDPPKPAVPSRALSSESPDPQSEPESIKPKRSYSRSSGWGSGHQAGYDWAQENGISDKSACEEAGDHHNSPSFAEGCTAYVEGQR
jgi:hypothetical protein